MAKNTPKPKTSGPANGQKAKPRAKTKKQTCIDMLKRKKGASGAELQQATGWQPHSVRGFLSGTVRKLDGATLVSKITSAGERRYRIETDGAS